MVQTRWRDGTDKVQCRHGTGIEVVYTYRTGIEVVYTIRVRVRVRVSLYIPYPDTSVETVPGYHCGNGRHHVQ